jgi:hypothetical protein
MKKKQRTLKYLDLELRTFPEASIASKLDLYGILKNAQRLLRAEQLQRRAREGASQHIRLLDIRFTKSKEYAVLLFTLADRDTVDATYERINDGEMRSFPKQENEGTRFSAHLVLRLTNRRSHVNVTSYLAMLEETRGLSPSAIESTLKSAIKKCGAGTYRTRDGEIDEYQVNSTLKGHTSRSLLQELLSGSLEGFTLVRNTEKQSLAVDERALLRERDYQLRIRVVSKGWRERLKDIFRQVNERATEGGYDTIRVQYSNEDGRPKTQDLRPDLDEPLKSLIVRSKTVNLKQPMHYNQERVDFGFAKAVIELASQEP